MKKVEDLYKEIISSEKCKAEFGTALKENKLEDFLKAHDCSATKDEVKEFLKAQQNLPLGDDILDGVTGGCSNPVGYSVVTAGVGCIMTAVDDCF